VPAGQQVDQATLEGWGATLAEQIASALGESYEAAPEPAEATQAGAR
jgi:hypothetical protein